jgi:hypothetical protein
MWDDTESATSSALLTPAGAPDELSPREGAAPPGSQAIDVHGASTVYSEPLRGRERATSHSGAAPRLLLRPGSESHSPPKFLRSKSATHSGLPGEAPARRSSESHRSGAVTPRSTPGGARSELAEPPTPSRSAKGAATGGGRRRGERRRGNHLLDFEVHVVCGEARGRFVFPNNVSFEDFRKRLATRGFDLSGPISAEHPERAWSRQTLDHRIWYLDDFRDGMCIQTDAQFEECKVRHLTSLARADRAPMDILLLEDNVDPLRLVKIPPHAGAPAPMGWKQGSLLGHGAFGSVHMAMTGAPPRLPPLPLPLLLPLPPRQRPPRRRTLRPLR